MWALSWGDERVVILGYLGSTFDLLNVRDLDLIEQAAARCDYLVVGVFTDDLVEERSGRRPIVPIDERVRLVAGLRGVGEARVHAGWPEGDETMFALQEDADLVVESRHPVIVRARRESRSGILRQALGPVGAEAVA